MYIGDCCGTYYAAWLNRQLNLRVKIMAYISQGVLSRVPAMLIPDQIISKPPPCHAVIVCVSITTCGST